MNTLRFRLRFTFKRMILRKLFQLTSKRCRVSVFVYSTAKINHRHETGRMDIFILTEALMQVNPLHPSNFYVWKLFAPMEPSELSKLN